MSSSERLLVPVSESATLRATVGYAVESALESASPSAPATIRFVYIHSPRLDEDIEDREHAEELLSRVTVWAEEDAGDHEAELRVETTSVGGEEYIFGPSDVAALLESEITSHETDRIVLDPEYDPGIGAPLLRPLEVELARETTVSVEEAPVEHPTRRVPLLRQQTAVGVGALFGLSFIFYQVLGGTFDLFDIVTGTISATIVAVSLARVSLNRRPNGNSLARLGRGMIYIPYLLYEIVLANIVVAAVILNPRLPIDPRMTRVRARLIGPLPVTTLANSITLTPGTLTVRVRGQDLVVHTLVPWARDGLFDGSLERAVRFLFYGRSAMAIPSPLERDETEVLQQPSDAASESGDGDTPTDAQTDGENQ
ncbi:monovalent cation/H+ antiporter subunit E [Salinibaculum salinum]|uniref:monovalent cation/H+ antiporter subunit E n=1 Tax=Salinibaculum salinum TaxID=3131996 RepID=UPI0030EC1573